MRDHSHVSPSLDCPQDNSKTGSARGVNEQSACASSQGNDPIAAEIARQREREERERYRTEQAGLRGQAAAAARDLLAAVPCAAPFENPAVPLPVPDGQWA